MRKRLDQQQCDRIRRLCQIHSMRTVARIVGVQPNTIRDVRDRGWQAGFGDRVRRARPTDFAIQADHMTQPELAAHYHASGHTVARWRAELGIGRRKPARTCPPKQIPDGSPAARDIYGEHGSPEAFATAVRGRPVEDVCALYGVSQQTLRRWRRRFGLPISWSRQPRRASPSTSMVGWADRYHQENANVRG